MDSECWGEFMDWCTDNNINLEHKDDWADWWHCWTCAIKAYQVKQELDRI